MAELKPVAGESDITPLNYYIRVQNLDFNGDVVSGTVTDVRQDYSNVAYGDKVYFFKKDAVVMNVNGKEIIFVDETNLIFKVG